LTLGVQSVALAEAFDAHGEPVGAQPFTLADFD
jgi:hypothetical protein